jgi:hypothetical protein
VLKLLHQPEIYTYHQKINVLVGKGYSRGEAKKEAMLELLGIDPVIVTQDGTFPKSNKKIWEDIKRIGYSNPLNLREIQPLGSRSTFNKEVLVYYLVGLAQADALRKVQSKNNFDTSTNPSYKMSNIQEENPDVEVDGLFSLESSDKIHNDSVISHLNVHEEFKLISEAAFGIKNDKVFVDFVTQKGLGVKSDKEKFVRVIDNDFLMAIIQNLGNEDLVEVQNLMTGPLMDTWANLKEKYPELKDTVLGSKLIADRYEDFVNPMYFVGLDNDTDTYDTLAQDIQNLLNGTPDQAQFAKDLVRVAFFQSGFNQSKLYMLKGIPPSMITAITSEAYTKFTRLGEKQKQEFINKFWQKFLQNRVLEFGSSFVKEYNPAGVNAVKAMFDKRNFRFMKYQFDFNEQVQSIPVTIEITPKSTNYTEHTLYSGDAIGADKLWAAQSKEFGVGKTVNYKVETLNSLTKPQQEEVESAYLKAKDDLGRKTLSYNWVSPQREDYVGGLVRRDYLQAKAADAIFAISDIIGVGEKGKASKGTRYTSKSSKEIVDGGTGYAVQMAINLNKPVYVFHQGTNSDNKASVGWYKWDYSTEKFVSVPTPVLTKKFAGIGTREINEAGKQAIKEIFNNSVNTPSVEPVNTQVKGGVAEVFNENSELSKIGTLSQYSEYLETIFPDSKLKDIVYHGSANIFEEFDINLIGKNTPSNKPLGIYFTPNSKIADFLYQGTSEEKFDEQGFRYKEKVNTGKVYAALLNLNEIKEGVNFIKEEDPIDEYDTENLLKYDAYVAKDKNQIYILGSNKDIEGFKNFVEVKPSFENSPLLDDKVVDLCAIKGKPNNNIPF